MSRFSNLLCATLLTAATAAGAAQAQPVAGTLRAGTDGLGVGVTARLVPTLNARVDAHFFSYGAEGVEVVDDIDIAYEADGNVMFVSALADWHPFRNGIRLSAGLLYNGLEGSGSIAPDEDIDVGSRTYTPEEVGVLELDVDFDSKIAPYFGLGYGNPVSRRIGFLLDLGMIYAGSPSVAMRGDGILAPTAEEAPQIEDNISWIQWYPVVSIGISARLF